MFEMLNNSELQRKIGFVSDAVADDGKPYIITKYGKPKMILLPYVAEHSDLIERYCEDLEMRKNEKMLKNRYKKSLKAGESDLIV